MIYEPKSRTNYLLDDDKNYDYLKLALDVSQGVLWGPDGIYWAYTDGVYKRDQYVIQRRVNEILGHKAAPRHTNNVIHIIDPLLEQLTHEKPDSTYINLADTMYNTKHHAPEPHSPHFHSIVQLPIFYDPAATCENFDKFLKIILSPADIPMIWEVIAYLLIPGNPFQKAILLFGEGSNGKSSLINVIEALIGRHNTANLTLNQLSRIFEPAELVGKQLNAVGDLDLQYLQDTENFKKITGGDPITAQRKNRDPFTFVNWAVPVFAANNMWQSKDLSEGYFRRWQIIEFPNKVNEKSFPFTREDLTTAQELSGIFNKAMTYLPAVMKRRRFQTTMANEMLIEQFKDESDNVATWLKDDERITEHQPYKHSIYERKTYAYQRYRSWCQESSHKPVTNQKFYKRLNHHSYTFDRKDNQYIVYGLSFKE